MSSLFHLLLEKAPYQASPGSRVRAVRPKCWYLSSMICMMVTLPYWTSLCLPGKLWQPMEDGEGVHTPVSSGTFVLFPVAQLLEQTLIKRNESTSNYRVRKEACRNIWITVRTSHLISLSCPAISMTTSSLELGTAELRTIHHNVCWHGDWGLLLRGPLTTLHSAGWLRPGITSALCHQWLQEMRWRKD